MDSPATPERSTVRRRAEPRAATDPVAAAKAYPFAAPASSYLYVGGEAVPFAEVGRDPLGDGVLACDGAAVPVRDHLRARGLEAGAEARLPLVAFGANRAPERLARKFRGFPGAAVFPVVRARLDGFDAVYSCHLSRYGAVPATLHPSPGTRVAVAVLWLTPAQLAHMHTTEATGANYRFGRLAGLRLWSDGGRALDQAFCYLSLHGCLVDGAGPMALAAIAADGRRFPARAQVEAIAFARDRLAPGAGIDAFIGAVAAADTARRRAWIRALRPHGRRALPDGFSALWV